MKLDYPIVISKEKNAYLVHVPDLKIDTWGNSFDEAISMAYDAIGETYLARQDSKLKINKPSNIEKISKMTKFKKNIITHVAIDPNLYRIQNDNKAVRRNITIPNWLDRIVRKKHLNVSEFLKESLIKSFNLKEV